MGDKLPTTPEQALRKRVEKLEAQIEILLGMLDEEYALRISYVAWMKQALNIKGIAP